MTAISDVHLRILFSQYQKQVYDLGMAMMSQTAGDFTRDTASRWSGEACDAFVAALNARLAAADAMARTLEDNYHSARGELHYPDCRSCAALRVFRELQDGR